MAATWKKLAYEADCVLKSLFDAQSIIAAVSDNTPVAVTVGEQTIVGRKTGGNIAALSAAEVLAIIGVESGADATDATNVAAAGAVMESDYTAKGMIIIGTGVGTAAGLASSTNGYVLTLDSAEVTGVKWAAVSGSGDFKADGSVPMTGALDFDNHAATDLLIQAVANEAAVAAYADPQVGKILFATSELTLHICTAAA